MIDPPYNRGRKDFIYNDNFVNLDDGFKHSKWLSKMEPRLNIAKQLLSEKGVIIISIDEYEFAQLKLLLDKIFSEKNFVGVFVRKTKSSTNDSDWFINLQHEYAFVYSKSKMFRFNGVEKNLDKYSNPDNDPNGRWNSSDPSAKSGGDSTYFPIENPYTKQIDFPPKGRYWAFSKESMLEYIESGKITFKKTKKINQRGFVFKTYLNQLKNQKKPIDSLTFTDNFYMNQVATKEINNLGFDFDYPKPIKYIKDLIEFSTDADSIVLDFYAGTGTTGQAVLELNQEDGGNRRFILCTNNENNICSEVTYPRLKTVITGNRPNGTKYSGAIPANLHYFKTDFIPHNANPDQAKYDLVEKVNNLLCILEDVFNLEMYSERFYVYSSNDKRKEVYMYIDYYEEKSFKEFISKINESNAEEKVAYIFSSDNVVDKLLFAEIEKINLKPIPAKIYEIYKEIVEDIKRG